MTIGRDSVNDRNPFTVSSPLYINSALLTSPHNQIINPKANGDTYFVHIPNVLNLDVFLGAQLL